MRCSRTPNNWSHRPFWRVARRIQSFCEYGLLIRMQSVLERIAALAILMIASAPAHAQSAKANTHPRADSRAAAHFAGCYRIVLKNGDDYHLQLSTRRSGDSWDAHSYGSSASNGAGNSWTWTPIDATTFWISWHGIDSAMEFRIVRHGSELVARSAEYSGNSVPREQIDARVFHIACRSSVP